MPSPAPVMRATTAPDGTEAEEPDGLAVQFVAEQVRAPHRPLGPAPDDPVGPGDALDEGEEEPDRVLGDRGGVVPRVVEHRDAMVGRRLDVDVDRRPEMGDDDETPSAFEEVPVRWWSCHASTASTTARSSGLGSTTRVALAARSAARSPMAKTGAPMTAITGRGGVTLFASLIVPDPWGRVRHRVRNSSAPPTFDGGRATNAVSWMLA